MSTWFDSGVNMSIVLLIALCTMVTIIWAIEELAEHSIWQKILVATANFAAGFAVICLALGFYYTTNKPLVLALITPNTSAQAINDYIETATGKEIKWATLEHTSASDLAREESYLADTQITYISSVNQLALLYPAVSQITLLGDGLNEQQWELLKGQYSLHSNNLTQGTNAVFVEHVGYSPRLGLTNIKWPKRIVVGQQAIIEGTLQTENASNDILYQVILIDPSGAELESILLSKQQAFSFTISANLPGLWQYTLNIKERGKDKTLLSEKVSIEIINAPPVKLMIKQSSPSFETRHLSNTLWEMNASVLILSKISKNKDIRQQINISQTDDTLLQTPVSFAALAFFDLLIIDQQALANLSSQQQEVLGLAIKNGLGVLVQAQSKQIQNWQNMGIDWLKDVNIEPSLTESGSVNPKYLRWQHRRLDIPITSISASINAPLASAIVTDQNDQALVVTHPYGLGKVAVSLVNSTYTWKTQGNVDLHSHYWQWLFSQIGRISTVPTWQPSQNIVLSQQAQQHCIINSRNLTKVWLSQGQEKVPLNTSTQLLDENELCVNYALSQANWFTLNAQNKNQIIATFSQFAYNNKSWQAWQQAQTKQATTNALSNQQAQASANLGRTLRLNNYWFWFILVIALSSLWIERKYYRK